MLNFSRIIPVFMIAFLLTCSFGYAETVKIVAEDDWFPYSARTADGPKGIAVDIVREAFKAEGIDVEFDVMGYDRGMLMVKDGKAIGCFDAPRTKEIEETYLWHEEPMFAANSFFYAASDYEGKIESIEDIGSRKLGLTQGYGYGDVIDTNVNLNKEYSKTDEVILKKLIAKRVDFIVLYDKVAEHLISKLNVQGQIKAVGPSESADIYVAFSKKTPDGEKYRDMFNSGFQKIKENGVYQKVLDDWEEAFKNSARRARFEYRSGEIAV